MVERELGAFAEVDRTDAPDFIDRLDRLHRVDDVQAYKALGFAALGLRAGDKVADVGCGAGDDVAYLASQVGPSGQAIGIDLSAAMVAEAERRFGAIGNVSFDVAAADALPFNDGEFDAIRADRVLIHVADPRAAIAEMLRVLRPGGRMIISEPEILGSWVASADDEVAEAICRAVGMSCASPYLPRQLGAIVEDLAIEEPVHFASAMITRDFATVDRLFQFELVAGMLAQSARFAPSRTEAWLADQRLRRDTGRFCACMTMITAGAMKPVSAAGPAIPLGD